ncbi:alpha-keto acid decarboxylase family protein [Streptomyces fulvorobeus]|uniref:Alpha-keto-acid decarboxylase n=1 Tax=Streptomyces fulvorobeus TaxID=284028 RepID=A0A7J0CEZ6_9ACTN|nr:thiamine pyrophosphate-binding protein [Streptomyces fulvorobeus]NYE44534.1 indolepyruvate decarboxylase [Streptomyces fulvorobeus]GFN01070.1 alpha-keto-acid decarboxylase [Streptomyces fulvorobeus]
MNATDSPPETTITGHLLDRLHSLGVRHLFGVAGDYNLRMLDEVLAHPGMQWVGTASELGAAYAADGYARVRGFAAVLTTHGVGELSAINGVAGSYAEYVPLLHIAVGPPRSKEQDGAVAHHTLGDGDYEHFARAFRQVVCADALVRPEDGPAEIDRVITACLRESRPGYLRLPQDVALSSAPSPSGSLGRPDRHAADQHSLAAFLDAAARRIETAGTIAVLADSLVDRFDARAELSDLLSAGSLPHAVVVSGKGVVDESAPHCLGLYAGACSDDTVRTAIDSADLLIRAGVRLADTTSGGFTHGYDPDRGISAGPTTVSVDGAAFPDVGLRAALAGLARLVEDRRMTASTPAASAPRHPSPSGDSTLSQAYLWHAVSAAVRPDHTVVADQGTPLFGISPYRLPAGARFLAQPVWGSIGYSLPALLGAQLADPSRRGLLLIGDGAAQLTIQELGTIGRHRLTPVIVLVNNDGYTVERALHNPRAVYNDITPWRWTDLPAALGVPEPLVLTVRTRAELDRSLSMAAATEDRMVFIEACTAPDDTPVLLSRFAEIARRQAEDAQ